MTVRYYTRRSQVPLRPGETIGFTRGHGYYARVPAYSAVSLAPVRSLIVCGGGPLDALHAPASYRILLSADLNHGPASAEPWVSAALAKPFQDRGQRVFSWCDCRPEGPDGGTPADYAIEACRKLGLDGWYGQAESADQFDEALERGRAFGLLPVGLIGNLSALNANQLALVAAAKVLFVNETYYNVQPHLVPDWRQANAGVGGNCDAVYASVSEGAVYTPLAAQAAQGRFVKGRDSIYAPGMQPADWQAA